MDNKIWSSDENYHGQGRQFEAELFQQLMQLTGTTHLRTTAYHPEANGLVERLHRQIKAAIKCHETEAWTTVLPIIMMGIRAAWKEDLKATSAELIFADKATRAILRGKDNRQSRVCNRKIAKSNAGIATNPEEARKEEHLRFQGDGNCGRSFCKAGHTNKNNHTKARIK